MSETYIYTDMQANLLLGRFVSDYSMWLRVGAGVGIRFEDR